MRGTRQQAVSGLALNQELGLAATARVDLLLLAGGLALALATASVTIPASVVLLFRVLLTF